jgi:hypothetical protein
MVAFGCVKSRIFGGLIRINYCCINKIGILSRSPEKAGGGGSIPSLAAIDACCAWLQPYQNPIVNIDWGSRSSGEQIPQVVERNEEWKESLEFKEVRRSLREQEVPGSNPGSPTT